MRRFIVSFIVLLLCGVLPVQADSDQLLKSLNPSGYVNDFAGVMSSVDRGATARLLAELEQKTGAQVAVVTLKTLDGGQIDDFANRLFAQWGIGKKGKDNGILLLGATEEGRGNRLRIEVGYGLEGVLPDAAAGRILDAAVLPGWNQKRYGSAMASGAAAIAQRIASQQGVVLSGMPQRTAQRVPEHRGIPWLNLILLVLFIPVVIRHPWILLLLLSGGGGSRGGGFGGGGFGGGGFGGGMSGGGGASR